MRKSYSVEEERVRAVVEIRDYFLGSDKAVAIGIILNELVTNIFKYAYPQGKNGEIRLKLSENAGRSVLRIEDDGPGLPQGFDPLMHGNLGLKLSCMLAEQIGGMLVFESSSGGTTAVLTFTGE